MMNVTPSGGFTGSRQSDLRGQRRNHAAANLLARTAQRHHQRRHRSDGQADGADGDLQLGYPT